MGNAGKDIIEEPPFNNDDEENQFKPFKAKRTTCQDIGHDIVKRTVRNSELLDYTCNAIKIVYKYYAGNTDIQDAERGVVEEPLFNDDNVGNKTKLIEMVKTAVQDAEQAFAISESTVRNGELYGCYY